ncbi:MAG: hypothetical protein VB957_03435 [Pseudomonadales bacterium]|jgi:hypothetical protein
MKIFFSTVLVLNFLVEGLASSSLIAGPEGVQAVGLGGQWSMHYGFAALAIASVSLWAWPHRTDKKTVTTILGVLVTFHTGLFISLSVAGDQMAGMITHGVLMTLLIILFTQRSKWCESNNPIAK